MNSYVCACCNVEFSSNREFEIGDELCPECEKEIADNLYSDEPLKFDPSIYGMDTVDFDFEDLDSDFREGF